MGYPRSSIVTAGEETNEYLFEPRRVPAGERVLGRFRLLHELGAGGMASLYLALDETGCVLALKRLHPHLAAERRFVEMFADEASFAARINHPNVCQAEPLEQIDGQLCIPMEYVHGESLAALLQQLRGAGEPLPVPAALHLIGQACLGLDAAHELRSSDGAALNLVHRDISPHNLLVTYEGELKVVDFGIAAAAAKLHHTETGTIKGKLSYMAPEQTRTSRVDRRADVWSLGVVLHEALCGERAFAGASAAEVVSRVQAGELVAPRQLRPELPAAVERIILRAVAGDPSQRYPTALEMYRDVYGALVASRVHVTTRTLGEMIRRVFSRRYALREELRALAFTAPEVLEEEEQMGASLGASADTAPGRDAPGGRCEYCGVGLASPRALEAHLAECGQRLWWERNFAVNRGLEGAADASHLRRRAAQEPARPEGLWSRLRQGLRRRPRDPLAERLRSIESRLGTVRDLQASRLADRAMTALWAMVGEIADHGPVGSELLAELKPRLLGCANIVLAMTIEIEANAEFLATESDRELQRQIELLRSRGAGAGSPAVAQEIERNLRSKRALLAERERLRETNELLVLRMESAADAIELTQAKVLQIAASPAMRDMEANTQITVFLDSLLSEVEILRQSVKEVRD